jgi:hypothetical protein
MFPLGPLGVAAHADDPNQKASDDGEAENSEAYL